MSEASVVIVGSGLAGYAVVRELRRLDSEVSITMMSCDHAGFYSKPMLSNALATGKTPASLINADASKMMDQQKITIRPYTRVTAIDHTSKALLLENGEKFGYGQLVLALGADQMHLALPGEGAADILSVNDVDDYRQFREAIADKKSISILGAGLIGCEFANDLAVAGYQVNLVDISSEPLGRLFPSAAGRFMRQKLEALGVVFHMGAKTQRVERANGQLNLMLDSGETVTSDVVLSAVGLRPRIKLAQASGIEVNRGIVVNSMLQTKRADIYALGDCAEVEGNVLPFVMPITHAARAIAATLAGNPTPVNYPAMPVMVKTPACPTVVATPHPDMAGEWHIEAGEDSIKALFKDADGNLLGFALLGSATSEKNNLVAQLS